MVSALEDSLSSYCIGMAGEHMTRGSRPLLRSSNTAAFFHHGPPTAGWARTLSASSLMATCFAGSPAPRRPAGRRHFFFDGVLCSSRDWCAAHPYARCSSAPCSPVIRSLGDGEAPRRRPGQARREAASARRRRGDEIGGRADVDPRPAGVGHAVRQGAARDAGTRCSPYPTPGEDAMVAAWAWEDEAAGRLRVRVFPRAHRDRGGRGDGRGGAAVRR